MIEQNLSPVTRRVLGAMLIGTPLEAQLQPEMPAVEAVPVSELRPEARPEKEVLLDPQFISLLRANLHAAAEHVALRHEGPSFRTCTRPACLDAAKLIPQVEEIGPGATDAELEAVLDRVLTALEQSLPAAAPAVRTRPAQGGTSYSAVMAE